MIKIFLIFLLLTNTLFSLENLTTWDSVEGQKRLLSSNAKANLWPLLRYYECQINTTYCSVATAVMILNVHGVPKHFGKHKLFAQDEFFTDAVEAGIAKDLVDQRGMTLKELAHALQTFPLQVSLFEASHLQPEEMRQILISALKNQKQCILALYQRRNLSQEGGGHWSPIAAYDEESDSFLILDVARFKYPPHWVPADLLLQAMQTTTIHGQSRGFIITSK